MRVGERAELRLVAPDQDRIRHHHVAVGERYTALFPDCRDPADDGRVIEETLREARLEDELGAEVIWLAEHHFDGISVYGDYDSADLSWYAVVASEASHTVPPTASYYSGHRLNAAYYPHLVLAMANRGPNTNGSQFFFVQGDDVNLRLPKNYTIFGKVTQGLDVLDQIASVPVASSSRGEASVPQSDVRITKVAIEEK